MARRNDVVVSLEIRFLDLLGVFRMNVKGKGLREKEFVSVGKQRRELEGAEGRCGTSAVTRGKLLEVQCAQGVPYPDSLGKRGKAAGCRRYQREAESPGWGG